MVSFIYRLNCSFNPNVFLIFRTLYIYECGISVVLLVLLLTDVLSRKSTLGCQVELCPLHLGLRPQLRKDLLGVEQQNNWHFMERFVKYNKNI